MSENTVPAFRLVPGCYFDCVHGVHNAMRVVSLAIQYGMPDAYNFTDVQTDGVARAETWLTSLCPPHYAFGTNDSLDYGVWLLEDGLKAEIEYNLTAEQDDTDPADMRASGDDKQDAQDVARINKRLDSGDVWAWAYVRLTGTLEVNGATFTAWDGLGGCEYKDEKQFKEPGGYYDDMQDNVSSEIIAAYEQHVKAMLGVK